MQRPKVGAIMSITPLHQFIKKPIANVTHVQQSVFKILVAPCVKTQSKQWVFSVRSFIESERVFNRQIMQIRKQKIVNSVMIQNGLGIRMLFRQFCRTYRIFLAIFQL